MPTTLVRRLISLFRRSSGLVLQTLRQCYRGNGAGVLVAMRTAALNLLRLAGFDSIREGLCAVTHDIKALLAMATRQPQEKPS
jgi:hypothetical protein